MVPDPQAGLPAGSGLLSEQVHRQLRAAIVAGDLAPGERLVESEIARRLGVSQAPVREAIRQLAHEGLVNSVARRGSTVAEISASDADRARRVRVALESLAAREAVDVWTADADARGRGHERLDEVVGRMRVAAERDRPLDLRQADLDFHRAVVETGGNAFLLRAWTQLETSLYVLQVLGDPFHMGSLQAAVGWHTVLVDALVGGDADAAAAAFARHAAGDVEPPDA